jgi:hypothetical protein
MPSFMIDSLGSDATAALGPSGVLFAKHEIMA